MSVTPISHPIFPFMIAALLTLASCSNQNTTATPVTTPRPAVGATSSTVGTANMGVVVDGYVSIFRFTNGIKGSQISATLATNASGQFDLSAVATSYSKPVLLELSNPYGSTHYFDEASGTMRPFPTGQKLRAVVERVTGSRLAITPITEVATALAMLKVSVGGISDIQAIRQANQEVANAFLGGIDPVRTIPDDIRQLSATSSNGSAIYANTLAGIALVAKRKNHTPIDQAGRYATNLAANNAQLLQSDLNELTLAIASFNQNPPIGVHVPATSPNAVPVAFGQSITLDEDTYTSITLHGGDINGLPVSYTIESQPRFGRLTGTPPTLNYTPDPNFNGQDSFYFVVNNGYHTSTRTLVNIVINPIPDAPVASGGVLQTREGLDIASRLQAVDPDNNPLSFSIISQPSQGSIVAFNAATGEYIYRPAVNGNSSDSFTYQASDGVLTSQTATVAITIRNVNDAPIAADTIINLQEDSYSNIILQGSDINGDALSYTISLLPKHGILTGTAPNLRYTPDPNFNGSDSLHFYVGDGALTSNEATVVLNVTPVNDPPIATNRTLSLVQGRAIQFRFDGSDPENDPLSFRIITQPAHGTLTGASNGALPMSTITYAPATDFYGQDQITFSLNDGNGGISQGTIAITVISLANSNFDSDGDGLLDKEEITIYGTNPNLIDTDGDGFSDFTEIVTYGFDPKINNYRFNPLIADTPEISIRMLSVPDIRINYVETNGSATTIGTNRSTTSSKSVSQSYEASNSTSIASSWSYGSEVSLTNTSSSTSTNSVGVSEGFQVGIDSHVTGEVNFSHEQSTTNERSKTTTQNYSVEQSMGQDFSQTWSSDQTTENSLTLDNSTQFESNRTLESSDGEISMSVSATNSGHLTFTLENLFLSANYLNLLTSVGLLPIANLAFDATGGAFPSTTLAPGQSTGSMVFKATGINVQKIKAILRRSNGVTIRPTLYSLLDQDGKPYNFSSTGVQANDAMVVVDFNHNGGRKYVNKMIASHGNTSQNISIADALQSVLHFPIAVTDNYGNPTTNGAITAIDGLANSDPYASWVLLHAKQQGNGKITTTIYTTPQMKAHWQQRNPAISNLVANYNPNTIRLGAGDVLSIIYLQDSDQDGLSNRMEAIIGSDPNNRDTDGDGLVDGVEVKDGWQIAFTDINGADIYGYVFSNPALVDSDGDHVDDYTEANLSATSPFLRTNPSTPDTDGDGLTDNIDDQPIGPGGKQPNAYDELRLLNSDAYAMIAAASGVALPPPFDVYVRYDLPPVLANPAAQGVTDYTVVTLRYANISGNGGFPDPNPLKNGMPYIVGDTIACSNGANNCRWEVVNINNGIGAYATGAQVHFTDPRKIKPANNTTNTPAEVFKYITFVGVNGHYTRQIATRVVSAKVETLEFHMLNANLSNVRVIASVGSLTQNKVMAVSQFDCHITNRCQPTEYQFWSADATNTWWQKYQPNGGGFYGGGSLPSHAIRPGDGRLDFRWNLIVDGKGLNTNADQWHTVSGSGGTSYYNPNYFWNLPSITIDNNSAMVGDIFVYGNNSLTKRPTDTNGHAVFSIQVPATPGCHDVMLYFDEWDRARRELSAVAWPAPSYLSAFSVLGVANVDKIKLCRDLFGTWNATKIDPKSYSWERAHGHVFSSYDLTQFPSSASVTRKGNPNPIRVKSRTLSWNDEVTGYYNNSYAGRVQRVPVNADLVVNYEIFVK